ncbi:hypothetical protein [Commensalibacter oyaizuii]|uniref:DUF637 domain-containing protein n=1 Tax=Commensalibacter oyaizuii TaxID=3043873 RepID=A0ABT6Q1Y9_9PROT|nr:hypothetical protein [Commensalibacter sp. TBRC 16381]MDI2091132.1 hypothetical protein [Commensalibacter sp. TBRC 16381]
MIRDLSHNEVAQVSGALLGASLLSNLGSAIGSIADQAFKSVHGVAPAVSYEPFASQLGLGIGYIFDSVFDHSLSSLVSSNMTAGISGIVNAVKANNAYLSSLA